MKQKNNLVDKLKNRMVTTDALISDLEHRHHKKTREVACNFTQHITIIDYAIMTTKYLQLLRTGIV